MRAVGYTANLPIEDERSLIDLDLPMPSLRPRDLLVRVEAVSVNPRDVKSRKSVAASAAAPVVLGYDAAGMVERVGAEVSSFQPGDRVYYAGVLDRPGSNAEFQAVDERIVGRRPTAIGPEAASSLPLTALTAWEMLFDRLAIPQGAADGKALLIIGGAGGVPSIAIQLARALTGLTVVATASRPESARWVRERGAHHVVDHSKPLAAQVKALGIGSPDYILSTHTDERVWAAAAEIVAPQGRFGLIDDPPLLDLRLFKFKSVSIHWEAMFTRPMFGTFDMARQNAILQEVAALVDQGRLHATATQSFGNLCAANLRRAHAAIERGDVIGKITLQGFGDVQHA